MYYTDSTFNVLATACITHNVPLSITFPSCYYGIGSMIGTPTT